MHATSYSIKREFAGAHALITGASGYLGSVLLEQLLRTTDVERVYLLLRPRRGQSVQERASKLLQGPLFHKVRQSQFIVCTTRGNTVVYDLAYIS
jgi:fatty acyl-CoA reductase